MQVTLTRSQLRKDAVEHNVHALAVKDLDTLVLSDLVNVGELVEAFDLATGHTRERGLK